MQLEGCEKQRGIKYKLLTLIVHYILYWLCCVSQPPPPAAGMSPISQASVSNGRSSPINIKGLPQHLMHAGSPQMTPGKAALLLVGSGKMRLV
jgi:hypothetical protein